MVALRQDDPLEAQSVMRVTDFDMARMQHQIEQLKHTAYIVQQEKRQAYRALLTSLLLRLWREQATTSDSLRVDAQHKQLVQDFFGEVEG